MGVLWSIMAGNGEEDGGSDEKRERMREDEKEKNGKWRRWVALMCFEERRLGFRVRSSHIRSTHKKASPPLD